MFNSRFLVFLTAITLLLNSNCAKAGDIPMIDAHSQAERDTELSDIIPLMNKAGVSRTLLSARRGLKYRDLNKFIKEHPKRLTFSVRTKGRKFARGGDMDRFKKRINKQLKLSQVGAISEILIYHAEKGDRAPEIYSAFESPQVKIVIDAAIKKNWPLIIHIEFGAIGSGGDGIPGRKKLMANLKVFLEKYKDHPMALTHMGQLESKDARSLIEAHKNIHFITSHANPIIIEKSRQPWIDMFHHSRKRLADDWRALVIKYPERFILGFDNVWADHWGDFYLDQAKLWRAALEELPKKVAHMVAHQNAKRLWRLPKLPMK